MRKINLPFIVNEKTFQNKYWLKLLFGNQTGFRSLCSVFNFWIDGIWEISYFDLWLVFILSTKYFWLTVHKSRGIGNWKIWKNIKDSTLWNVVVVLVCNPMVAGSSPERISLDMAFFPEAKNFIHISWVLVSSRNGLECVEKSQKPVSESHLNKLV